MANYTIKVTLKLSVKSYTFNHTFDFESYLRLWYYNPDLGKNISTAGGLRVPDK